VHDHGGWTGGEFTLGGQVVSNTNGMSVNAGGLSRREVLAKAAEERMKRTRKATEEEEQAGEKGDAS